MSIIHHTFASEDQANTSYAIMTKRGFAVSKPWVDELNNWHITHIIRG